MISRWRPYQLGVWLNEYTQYYCQLCHSKASTQINPIPKNTRIKKSLDSINSGILCQNCHDSIVWLIKPLSIQLINHSYLLIQPISYYQHPIDQIICQFKFNEDVRMMPILVHMLRQLPIPKGCNGDNSVILPMPTTGSRLKNRGFDPLTMLFPYLSHHWGIPIWKGVARIDDTVSQRGLSKLERQRNMQGAFSVIKEIPVRRIILFDDVATTGSSLKELANTLLSINDSLQLSAYCLAHGNSMY